MFPLFSLPEVPSEKIALIDRLTPALVILLKLIVLLSFPVVPVVVEKNITPLVPPVSEPLIVQYLTILDVASLINRIVVEEVSCGIHAGAISEAWYRWNKFVMPNKYVKCSRPKCLKDIVSFCMG